MVNLNSIFWVTLTYNKKTRLPGIQTSTNILGVTITGQFLRCGLGTRRPPTESLSPFVVSYF